MAKANIVLLKSSGLKREQDLEDCAFYMRAEVERRNTGR